MNNYYNNYDYLIFNIHSSPPRFDNLDLLISVIIR